MDTNAGNPQSSCSTHLESQTGQLFPFLDRPPEIRRYVYTELSIDYYHDCTV